MPGVHKGVTCALEIVVVAVASCMRSEIERKWSKDIGYFRDFWILFGLSEKDLVFVK